MRIQGFGVWPKEDCLFVWLSGKGYIGLMEIVVGLRVTIMRVVFFWLLQREAPDKEKEWLPVACNIK